MWYFDILQKGWQKFARTIVQEKQEIQIELAKQLSGLHVTEPIVEEAIDQLKLDKEKPQYWTEEQLKQLATELRQKTKPMIIAANKLDVPSAYENLQRLQTMFPTRTFIGCSSDIELALREASKAGLIEYIPGEVSFKILDESKLSGQQKNALKFIQSNVLDTFKSTGIQYILNKAVFELLGYIAIYPGGMSKLEDKDGNVLPDCFLLPAKSTALDFEYKLHTDLGKNFICAKDIRTRKTVGKDYLLKQRDVIEIVAGK